MPGNVRKRARKITQKSEFDDNKPPKLLGIVQFLISWTIIIGLIGAFIWLNDNYLHLPIDGSSECSGMYEHNCGNPDNINIDDYPDRLDYR